MCGRKASSVLHRAVWCCVYPTDIPLAEPSARNLHVTGRVELSGGLRWLMDSCAFWTWWKLKWQHHKFHLMNHAIPCLDGWWGDFTTMIATYSAFILSSHNFYQVLVEYLTYLNEYSGETCLQFTSYLTCLAPAFYLSSPQHENYSLFWGYTLISGCCWWVAKGM